MHIAIFCAAVTEMLLKLRDKYLTDCLSIIASAISTIPHSDKLQSDKFKCVIKQLSMTHETNWEASSFIQ